jgi:hypothetical protein
MANGAGLNRKGLSVLVVGNSEAAVWAHGTGACHEGYNTASCLYGGSSTKLPLEIFDRAIVSDMNGSWKNVVEEICSKKTIVVFSKHTSEEERDRIRAMGHEPVQSCDFKGILEALE